MKIAVTAGHGGTDPGVVVGSTKEAEFCADMRNYVAYYLTNRGFTVVTDGKGATNAPLAQAIALAKSADFAIELHLNGAGSNKPFGVECLAGIKHKAVSQSIAKAIAGVTGTKLRGDDGWQPEDAGQHSRLGFVRAGGIIVELEFLSNPTRFATLRDKRWLVAKAIAEAIIEHTIK